MPETHARGKEGGGHTFASLVWLNEQVGVREGAGSGVALWMHGKVEGGVGVEAGGAAGAGA